MTPWMTAQEFKRIRRAAGMTLTQLADHLRINDVQSLDRMESGRRDVTGPVSLCMLALEQSIRAQDGKSNCGGCERSLGPLISY